MNSIIFNLTQFLFLIEISSDSQLFLISASQYNRYKSTFYLVFDFCEHDLAGLLSNVNVKFSLGEIKKVMQQLLNGLYYIHSNKVFKDNNFKYSGQSHD